MGLTDGQVSSVRGRFPAWSALSRVPVVGCLLGGGGSSALSPVIGLLLLFLGCGSPSVSGSSRPLLEGVASCCPAHLCPGHLEAPTALIPARFFCLTVWGSCVLAGPMALAISRVFHSQRCGGCRLRVPCDPVSPCLCLPVLLPGSSPSRPLCCSFEPQCCCFEL